MACLVWESSHPSYWSPPGHRGGYNIRRREEQVALMDHHRDNYMECSLTTAVYLGTITIYPEI